MASPEPSGIVNLKIFVDGKEIAGEFQIRSVSVFKEANRIATAEIYFIDGDANLQEFKLSDKSDLEPGKDIEIKVGYDKTSDLVFKGMIVKHGIKIRGGSTYTVIECKDKAFLMTIENVSDIYEKKNDSDILSTLIKKYGLTASVENTTFTHPQILKYDVTDWDFVISRAEMNGLLAYTINNEVIIKTPKVGSPVLTLEFGTNILEYEAQINAESQLSKVTATTWDIKKQDISKKVISSDSFDDAGSLSAATLASKVKNEGFNMFHPGALDQNELNNWAKAKFLRSKMAKMRGRVKCMGFAKINPGDTLELKGIGQKFNGKVFVSAVSHDISAGAWTTNIQFGFSDSFHAKKYQTNSLQASGLIPSIHGLQIGIVTKIDQDPDNQHRIQVKLPLFGAQTNVWARKLFPDAGNDRGVYFMPEINDEVIIGFLHDDARFPVIIGSLHSSKNKTPYVTDAENKEKGVVTREKLKLTFNDADKIITLETPAKQSIVIDDKNGTIIITDKSKNKITMKSNLIELNGVGDIKIVAKQNIEISGLKIDIKAQTDASVSATNIKNTANAQFKASGNAQAEISSGGQTTVKAGAMVQVQGALVKIN